MVMENSSRDIKIMYKRKNAVFPLGGTIALTQRVSGVFFTNIVFKD